MRTRPLKPMTAPEQRERRAHVRVPIRAAVTLVNGDQKVCGWVRNLSCGGMFVQADVPFPTNAEVQVDVLLREGYSVRRLRTPAWVAWSGDGGMGLQFDALTPDDLDLIIRTLQRFS